MCVRDWSSDVCSSDLLAIAVAFAVIFAKEVFGGTGYNFLNIALVTRSFLFFSYPSKMSGDNVFVSLGGSQAADSYTGATPLGQLASATEPGTVITNVLGDPLSFSDIFFGFYSGSWGETSTFCILIGAAILLFTGIASWRIMGSALIGGLLMSVLANHFARSEECRLGKECSKECRSRGSPDH